jgi:hypothetical protein
VPADQQSADSRWVTQIAAGDRGALQALYEIYFPRLARFFSHLSAAPVEQLINDTFLDVWRRSGEFNAHESAWVWIMRLALDHARRQQPTAAMDENALTYFVYTGCARDEVAEILNLSPTSIDILLTQARLRPGHSRKMAPAQTREAPQTGPGLREPLHRYRNTARQCRSPDSSTERH